MRTPTPHAGPSPSAAGDRPLPPPDPDRRRDAPGGTPPPSGTGTGSTAPPPSRPAAGSSGEVVRPLAGPPPPPIPVALPAADDTPRSTAATWVAATGALLLLVAAGIFLAVSWEVLGVTARVAIVASVTAAAIVGGHLLRRVLPAVGAVVFHLGALLLPIDAVGLALQLDLSLAATWTLAGLATVTTLPPLAIAGRSRFLAGAAVAGVPVLATGVGLAGHVAPSLLVAAAGFLALATLRLRTTRVARVWQAGPVALATTSVLLPLFAASVDLAVARGQLVAAVRAAGWAPSSWVVPTIAGALAVSTVTVRAWTARSRHLAGAVPVLAAVATLVALLPPGTPRLALLLAGPVFALLVQVVALLSGDEPTWSAPLRWAAGAVEIVGALGLVAVLPVVVAPSSAVGTVGDTELAAALAVASIAWGVAGLRRILTGRRGSPVLPLVGAGAALTAAGSLAAFLPLAAAPLVASGLVAVVAAAWLVPPVPAATSRWSAPTWTAAATALLLIAAAAAMDTAVALPVAALAAPLGGGHVARLLAEEHPLPLFTGAVTVPVLALASTVLAGATAPVAPLTVGLTWVVLQLVAVVIALFGLATVVDRLAAIADLVRGVAVAALLLALPASAVPWGVVDGVVTRGQLVGVELLRPVPQAVLVLAPALLWLVADARRRGRLAIGLLAVPVAVRLAASLAAAAGAGPVGIGAVLLGLGLAATVVALTATSRQLVWPMGAAAALHVLPGWALIGATPHVRALALIALGLVGVAAGVVRRNLVVGHLGGAVATVGLWSLLHLSGITAVDVWLLPVAAQLVAAGWTARRASRVSSWAIDVPPLLLVAVPALAERLANGPGWHTILAGGIALVAVIHGGASGRGGPLTVGIVVLVSVVLVETIAYAALVPTWAWFAAAGVVLLVAAVLIERHGLSPTRAVARLRDLAGDEPRR